MAEETPLSIRHPDGPVAGGVVVVQEVFGVTPHIEDVCQRLADVGWLAVAPHLYHRTGDPVVPHDQIAEGRRHAGQLTAEGILADVDAALRYVEGAGFPRDTTGIVGFCMGGTIAMVVAAARQVGAAVTFYGSGIANGRFGFPPLLEVAPKLRAPWLGLYGDLDAAIPVDEVEQLAGAAAGSDVHTEVVRYPDAGHGFNRDGSSAYHEPSARDAWMRMLDWFADNLTTGATETG
ncbi:MAG TPA: dienelactone hydrolase family protein [Acidimicrobiales bacterium]